MILSLDNNITNTEQTFESNLETISFNDQKCFFAIICNNCGGIFIFFVVGTIFKTQKRVMDFFLSRPNLLSICEERKLYIENVLGL